MIIEETLCFIALVISIIAYVPQIWKMYQDKCSHEISFSAWSLWLASTALSFPYILKLGDILILLFQITGFIAVFTTLFLAKRYEKNICKECRTISKKRK